MKNAENPLHQTIDNQNTSTNPYLCSRASTTTPVISVLINFTISVLLSTQLHGCSVQTLRV